jgi:hypothetical protein
VGRDYFNDWRACRYERVDFVRAGFEVSGYLPLCGEHVFVSHDVTSSR